MTSAVAPLGYGSFRTIWISSMLSSVGTFIQSVAGSWLMLELTGSNAWVGLMVASSTLPLLFLALAAGALADMFDRVRIMLVAQSIMGISALAMTILTVTDLINPGLLLGLGLLLGVGVALNLPAWNAILPDLVPRGMIASAVALQSAAFNVARAIGPAIGGLIVATIGAGVGFGINAITYGFVIVALIMVSKTISVPERQTGSITSAIGLGVRFARFTPAFGRLLSLLVLFAITSSVVQAVLPGHAETLEGGAGVLGLLLGAMGAGALVGAFIRQRFLDLFRHRSQMVTITGFGLAGIGVGLAPSVIVALFFMLLVGVFWVLTLTNLNATAQLMSPEWIRGRAMSLYSLCFGGILPLGAILAGFLADAVGTRSSMVILCSGSVALGLVSPRFRIPALEDVETPEFSRDRPPPAHVDTAEGGPVLVLNTWNIAESDYEAFTEVMNEVRLVRLRTGAYRWRLFRNVSDPLRLTELFALNSWEEHLAQHLRIDDRSAGVLAEARSFDRGDGPTTRHLVAMDIDNIPGLEELVTHEQMHRSDGSIPDLETQDKD
jgi:MFS family permease